MLNKSRETRHLCLLPNLIGHAQSYILGYKVSCGFLIYDIYYLELCSFYVHFLEFLL